MSTTPEDPFAAPPAGGTAPAPDAIEPTSPAPQAPTAPPPGVLVPGPLPTSTPSATPPGVLAGDPSTYAPPAYSQPAGEPFPPQAFPAYRPEPPRGLATATIALTGAYTFAGLLTAAMTPTIVRHTKETLADPNTASLDLTSTGLGLLTSLVAVSSFVFLALWMTRIRQNLKAVGVIAGGPPAVEWWGWFVPLANFVLPALGMRAISRRSVGIGVVLGWWLPFCASFVTQVVSSTRQFAAIDLGTGKLVNPGALDSMVPLAATTAGLVLISWFFLQLIIRRTTSRHLGA